jgi:hypothetical protein
MDSTRLMLATGTMTRYASKEELLFLAVLQILLSQIIATTSIFLELHSISLLSRSQAPLVSVSPLNSTVPPSSLNTATSGVS